MRDRTIAYIYDTQYFRVGTTRTFGRQLKIIDSSAIKVRYYATLSDPPHSLDEGGEVIVSHSKKRKKPVSDGYGPFYLV